MDTVDKVSRLLEAFITLVEAVAWPAIVVFFLLYFGVPLKKFLADMAEFRFKAGPTGIEASAKRQQVEAAALLGAATAAKQGHIEGETPLADEDKAREIAKVVNQATKPKTEGRLLGASILWVDNSPAKDIFERKAMEVFGVRFTDSASTEDALEKIKASKFDLIISDMNRPPDDLAGYTLLAEKKALGDDTPLIIYAGSSRADHRAEARTRGAFGSAGNPQELFMLVLYGLRSH
ncbi:MAG: response regulator [Chloroflexi bacterium]|nr:response regulator [Chloroflexota bacterium]